MVVVSGKKVHRYTETTNFSVMGRDQGLLVPSDADAIRILHTCMQILEEQLIQVPSSALEKQTGMLWARKLDYTYDDDKKSRELEHDARRAASYILVDQVSFYHILSLQSPEYPPLEELLGTDPTQLRKYFDKVLFGDYQAVFDFNIVNLLPKTAPVTQAINFVIHTIKNSKIAEIRRDLLGKIFHQLIPMEIRRHLAAFYTSNEAAALLAHLVIDHWDATILDLACGSGTLLTEAYLRKRALMQHPDDSKAHRELLSQIFGNDVAQFAAHLATINLALQGNLSRAERVNVTVGDGFEISPATLMAHDSTFKRRKPSLNGSSEEIVDYPSIDVVLMNPPFTQHKRLNPVEKEKIHATLMQEGLGKYLNGRMGLHALFILHADTFLPVGGRMALVLPANTFSSNYGINILQLFRDKRYSIDFLIERVGSANTFSEQCGLKEYLLVVTKGRRIESDATTLLVTLNTVPDYVEVPLLAEFLEEAKSTRQLNPSIPPEIRFSSIPQEILLSMVNWNSIFQQNTSDGKADSKLDFLFNDPECFIPVINAVQVKIRRGFDGTHIDELSLPNKVWTIATITPSYDMKIQNRYTRENLTIPKRNLLRSFRLPRLYEKIFTPGPQEYLLIIPEHPPLSGDLERYVSAMTEQLNGRRIKEKKEGAARTRNFSRNWYSHTARFKSQNRVGHLWIVWKFNIKTRRGFGFYATEPGAAHNAFYQVVCNNANWEPILAAWFNSSLWVYQLLTHSRSLTSQYHQLMIEDVKKTCLPLLERIKPEFRERIYAAARALDEEVGDSFRELFLAGKIIPLDRAWLEALGLPSDDITPVLDELTQFFHQIFARFELVTDPD